MKASRCSNWRGNYTSRFPSSKAVKIHWLVWLIIAPCFDLLSILFA